MVKEIIGFVSRRLSQISGVWNIIWYIVTIRNCYSGMRLYCSVASCVTVSTLPSLCINVYVGMSRWIVPCLPNAQAIQQCSYRTEKPLFSWCESGNILCVSVCVCVYVCEKEPTISMSSIQQKGSNSYIRLVLYCVKSVSISLSLKTSFLC